MSAILIPVLNTTAAVVLGINAAWTVKVARDAAASEASEAPEAEKEAKPARRRFADVFVQAMIHSDPFCAWRHLK